MENGRPNINVIAHMDIIVPTPNNNIYPKPNQKESIVGNKTNMTAALPARPWMIPIINDLRRK